MIEDFMNSSVASVIGFVGGYLVCMLVRFISESPKPFIVRLRGMGDQIRTVVGIVILSLAAMTLVSINTSTHCQAEYNDLVLQGLKDRSVASGSTNDALLEAIRAQRALLTSNPNRDPQVGLDAIKRYLAALDEQERSIIELEAVRRANPYPERPEC